MKFSLGILLLALNLNVFAASLDESNTNAKKIYVNDETVQALTKELESKGSSTSMCSYIKSSDGIKTTVISVSNVPGDQFISILVSEKFICTTFNMGQEDEMTDVKTITAIVKVHNFPKQNDDGSFSSQSSYDLKLINLNGEEISELEEGSPL